MQPSIIQIIFTFHKCKQKLYIIQKINNKVFIIKISVCSTTRCNKWCDTTWHGVKQILNSCLRKSIFFVCLYKNPSVKSYRRRIRSETPIIKISHIFNWQRIQRIRRSQKKLYIFCRQEVLNCSFT